MIILIIIITVLILKIIIMKKELKNINKELNFILKQDTNQLITVISNDKDIKKFVSTLNKNLKMLRTLELEYKQGNQDLKDSIINISHDLRTPLTVIRGYLDIMEETKKLKNKKYLKIIDEKVKDMTYLTDKLFDYTKSLDKDTIKKEKININELLENSIISFYKLFKEKNITPKIEICKEKIYRFIDPNISKRIIENIIYNALKYSEKDFKIKMYKSGKIEFSNKTNLVDNVSVEKIFGKYYTLSNTKKSHGLGLKIAKQLIEINGGTINANYINGYLTIEINF